MKSKIIIFSVVIISFFINVQCNSLKTSRMWHGLKTDDEIIPYHVHIWIYDQYDYTWPGSGVLITNKHVLTAAVNIHHYSRWDLGVGSKLERELKIMTSYTGYIHEDFDDTTDDNNIGVIVLPEELEFSEYIAPIAFPKPFEDFPGHDVEGVVASFSYLSDYGPISTHLEHGLLKTLSEAECENVYPHINGIARHFFCAQDIQFNVCGGAQGAGLAVKRNNEDILAGIVSFGSLWHGCSTHQPPALIKITEYVRWIEDRVKPLLLTIK